MDRTNFKEIKEILDRLQLSLHETETTHDKISASIRDLEISIRRHRDKTFPTGYFSDPAWDILLDLDQAERQNISFHVTDIGRNAHIPLTTLLRYLALLEKDGFVMREQHKADRRKAVITLTQRGRDVLEQIFDNTIAATKAPDARISPTLGLH